VKRLAAAGGGDDVRRVEVDALVSSVFLGDRLAQRPRSLVFGVGVRLSGLDCVDGGLTSVGRGREVGLADPQLIASSPAASNTSRIPLIEIRSTLSEKFGMSLSGR